MPVIILPHWNHQCWNFQAEYVTGVNIGHLNVVRFDGYLEITEIFVIPEIRELNVGNSLMKAITRYADAEKVELRATVRRIIKNSGGEVPTMAELMKFFRKHGFKSSTDHPEVMRRRAGSTSR